MNTVFLKDIVGNMEVAALTTPISGYVAYGPPGSGLFFKEILPPHIAAFEAWSPRFGECLLQAIDHLLAQGHTEVAVLNSDSPTLPPAFLSAMADALGQPGDRAVLGPSSDGGYYMLGLKAPHGRLFADIDWSTSRVAEQTLARAREIDLPVHVLPTWYDVDDADSLRTLCGELFGDVPFGAIDVHRGEARHSRAYLQEMLAGNDLGDRIGLR